MGLAIERNLVRAVVLGRSKGKPAWAAEAPYQGIDDLATVLMHLAGERPRSVKRARVALGPGIGQMKVLRGMPAMKRRELATHVAILPRRYFLQNGDSLVTDAAPLGAGKSARGSCLAAAPSRVVDAVVDGLRGAGLRVEAIAPAGVWMLERSSGDTAHQAPAGEAPEALTVACAAAAHESPVVTLLPPALRAEAERASMRSIRRWAIACLVSAGLAACAYTTLVVRREHEAVSQLEALRPALRRVLETRRDLNAATEALVLVGGRGAAGLRAARVLSGVARALPDSAVLTLFRVTPDGHGTIAGHAVRAAAVAAALEQIPFIARPAIEGTVSREPVAGREWDRFSVRFRLTREAHP